MWQPWFLIHFNICFGCMAVSIILISGTQRSTFVFDLGLNITIRIKQMFSRTKTNIEQNIKRVRMSFFVNAHLISFAQFVLHSWLVFFLKQNIEWDANPRRAQNLIFTEGNENPDKMNICICSNYGSSNDLFERKLCNQCDVGFSSFSVFKEHIWLCFSQLLCETFSKSNLFSWKFYVYNCNETIPKSLGCFKASLNH